MALTPGATAEADTKSEPTVQHEPNPKKKPFVKSPIVIGATVLVLVGSITFGAIYYFRGSPKVSEDTAATQSGEGRGAAQIEVRSVLVLEPFLVNLADKDEIRFVKATFQLGLSEEPSEEAKGPIAIAAMRDSIISLLSSKTAEEILTSQGKDKLREEIRIRVGSVAPEIKVSDVYIVDFIVQL